MAKRVEWSDLPKELWAVIGKRLNTTIDVLRFRSVCKSWRSAIPLPSSHLLFAPRISIPRGKSCLVQTNIYRLELVPSLHDHVKDPSISSSKGWMIKVRESKSVPLRLLDPFTNFRVSDTHRRYPPGTSPKVLNLLNFRFVKLIEAYSLNYDYGSDFLDEDECEYGMFMRVLHVRKVVLFPSFPSEEAEGGRMVFALYKNGNLGVSKIGDEDWTVLNDGNARYDDIIIHKGQPYVVDEWGTIWWINCSTLELVQFSPRLCGFGKRKHLVGSGGSLYVVDMHIEGEPDNPTGMYSEVLGIKVYGLDEEWGKWLDVKNLGDVLFVLGKDCNFSLSAPDYHGCEGNCIYFCDKGRACVFRLQNSKFKSPNLFWPCPTLFHPKFNV